MNQILKYLPEGPMFYPEDQISDQPERSIAAEMIREKLILLTEEELPYSTAVVIDRFEEEGPICIGYTPPSLSNGNPRRESSSANVAKS